MSEIPFVKALGDEIERAAKRRRGRVRRRIAFGAVAFAIAATGVAAASGVFTSAPPDQLATTGISCYTGRPRALRRVRSLHQHGVADRGLPPGDAHRGTARRLRRSRRDGLPGPAGTCEKLGLQPLPAEYAAARKRVGRLARRLEAIEASDDCWDPRGSPRRVQRCSTTARLARLADERRRRSTKARAGRSPTTAATAGGRSTGWSTPRRAPCS